MLSSVKTRPRGETNKRDQTPPSHPIKSFHFALFAPSIYSYIYFSLLTQKKKESRYSCNPYDWDSFLSPPLWFIHLSSSRSSTKYSYLSLLLPQYLCLALSQASHIFTSCSSLLRFPTSFALFPKTKKTHSHISFKKQNMDSNSPRHHHHHQNWLGFSLSNHFSSPPNNSHLSLFEAFTSSPGRSSSLAAHFSLKYYPVFFSNRLTSRSSLSSYRHCG